MAIGRHKQRWLERKAKLTARQAECASVSSFSGHATNVAEVGNQAGKCELSSVGEGESEGWKAKGLESGGEQAASDNSGYFNKRRRVVRDPWVAEKFKQDKHLCLACGWRPPSQSLLHAHHVNPLSCGGLDEPDNLIALCPNCHALAHYVAQRSNLTRRYSGPRTRDGLLSLIAKAHDPQELAAARQRAMIKHMRPLIDSLRRSA